MENVIQLPSPSVIKARIEAVRKELAALKRLLKMATTAQQANINEHRPEVIGGRS